MTDELKRARDALTPADEIARLKTVMIAAAEEIHAHWDAHCDAEGYGPANLMRRLEEGIPAEYGYTAGAFAELKAEVERLRAAADAALAAAPPAPDAQARDAARYRLWRDAYANGNNGTEIDPLLMALSDAWTPDAVDAAIDAAMQGDA